MVTQRKASAVPQAPTSTPSKKNKGNTKESSSTASNGALKDTSSGQSSSLDTSKPSTAVTKKDSPSKVKGKGKAKKVIEKTRPRNSVSFFDNVIRVILASFAIYALTVCPKDHRLESPICRTLAQYRELAEPYVMVPARYIAAHPKVAPYVDTARPHVENAIRISRPILQKTSDIVVDVIVPRWHILRQKATPYIQPYMHRLQVEYAARAQPYLLRAQVYSRRVQPYINTGVAHSKHAYRIITPRVKYLIKFASAQWKILKPHLLPLWAQVEKLPEWLLIHVGGPLLELKGQYVDTQIGKIWAKIEELGGETSHSVKAVVNNASITSTVQSTSSIAAPTAETVASSVSSVAAAAVSPTSTIPEVLTDVSASITSSVAEASAAASETLELDPNGFVDLEEFLASLAAEDEESIPISTTVVVDESQQTQTPEDAAEAARVRQEIMAEKRVDIETRHTDWEAKVDQLGKHGLANLVTSITAIREKAVEEINSPEGWIREQVIQLEKDADKALKGTEAYARKLMSGQSGGAEKVGIFEAVADKVEARYTDAAKALSDKIAQWWVTIREEVEAEAERFAAPISNLAAEAQNDLGMDYAWLDDVTANDWTRYHNLVRTAEYYATQYQAILAGSHPKAPQDPLSLALSDLQAELQDLLISFQGQLGAARQEGLRLFVGKKAAEKAESASKEPTFSILPVVDARDDYDPSAWVGRGAEEVEAAINRASAAGETVVSRAKTSSAASGKPTPKSVDEIVDEIFGSVFDVHHTPETFSETVEGAASSAKEAIPTIPSVADVEDLIVDKSASVVIAIDDAQATLHAKVEDHVETLNDQASSVGSQASSIISSVTSSAESIVATPPSVEDVKEFLVDEYGSASVVVADTHVSVTDIASGISSQASSAVVSATNAIPTIPSAEEFSSTAAAASDAAVQANVAEAYEAASTKVHSATRSVASAVGATPSLEHIVESVASLRAKASSLESSLRSQASSVANNAKTAVSSASAAASQVVHGEL